MISQSPESVNDCELNVSTQWKNLSIYDEQKRNTENKMENENSVPFIDDRALRMMHKMGYKSGSGLGKNEQGITRSIDVTCNLGKRGLGLNIKGVEATRETWDFSKEEAVIVEEIIWLENQETENETENFASFFVNRTAWIKEGLPNYEIENEIHFCDKDILHNVLEAKNIFDELDIEELNQARTRSNPFETIRSVFFMNRAALKMANIDATTGFMFSNIDQNVYHKHSKGPFYFADVCAGPGGFSEYILWRKGWSFKGFGLTLKDGNDFKLHESTCASSATFEPLYGKLDDGNVCCPENITDFKEKIMHGTEGQGVHFMVSDGGFSVEGNENIQEILSKNIYICQCLVALEIVREHGHFATKLFDVFTTFSVGLLYLMYKCFKRVLILKPNSSRPANAERYFICSDLRKDPIVEQIKEYMWIIVRKLWETVDNPNITVLDTVPLEVIKKDEKFCSYIIKSNNSLGDRQIRSLKKLATFCRNPSLVEIRQYDVRKECLKFWRIPDIAKVPQITFTGNQLLSLVMGKPEIVLAQPREVNTIENFNSIISDVADWQYCPMYWSRKATNCYFYAGIAPLKVYRLQRNKWVKVKNLQLVKGTVLYGEFVKEKQILKRNVAVTPREDSYRYSLHVIDALRLGDKNISDMEFKERMELIQIYCKSVNKESVPSSIRIRPKLINTLLSMASQPSFKKENASSNSYISTLPPLGYDSFSEVFDVNSLLLLKTKGSNSFQSIYDLSAQIFVKTPEDQNEEKFLSLENLIHEIKPK